MTYIRMNTHIRTHAHTHTHMHTHTHTNARTHIYTHTHARTRTHTYTHTHTHDLRPIRVDNIWQFQSYLQWKHTHTHTHAHTHTHIHTHTHDVRPIRVDDIRHFPLYLQCKHVQWFDSLTVLTVWQLWQLPLNIPVHIHMISRQFVWMMTFDTFHWTYAASPKFTNSRNSDSSVSRGTNSKWDFGVVSMCTEEFEFLDSEDFGGVAFLESVIAIHYAVTTISRLLKIIGLFCKRAL